MVHCPKVNISVTNFDINRSGKSSVFIKTAPSTYNLNPNRPNQLEDVDDAAELEELDAVDGSYIGKGGEFLVCSELLFRGFNASIMSVDTGIDIAATMDNQLYGVQVKTARLNKFNTYVFDVRKVSFERHNSGSTFYIFVLYSEKEPNYLILQSLKTNFEYWYYLRFL